MQRRLSLLAAAVAAVALVATAACSDDDDDRGPRSAPTTTSTGAPPSECGDAPRAADGTEAEVVGTTDDLVLAVVDRGASVEVVSLFDGCPPEPVLLDGAPAAFPVGGTVTHGDGLRCRPGGIDVLSATSDDGATYQVVTKSYDLAGGELVLADESAGTIEAHDEPDRLRAHYEIDCSG